MGEWGNTSYIRPIFVRAIVDKVKEFGGEPFVTDTTTLPYLRVSGRQTARDYLMTAASNGFTKESMGCPIVIADGRIGLDDYHLDFPQGVILEETYIAKGIAEADAMIVVSHFKGHGWGVYGGAIKNVGVGCVSKRGKVILHLLLHPKAGLKTWEFDGSKCIGEVCEEWMICQQICPAGAINILKDRLTWIPSRCIGCFGCVELAGKCCIRKISSEFYEYTVIAMADSASAVLNYLGKENIGFVNIGMDLSPLCDCASWSDLPIMPNLGIFASKDMVAVDTATLDMTMQLKGAPYSLSEEKAAMEPGTEKFTLVSSENNLSQWMQINVCEELGVGTKNYELIVEPIAPDWWRYCFPKYKYPKKPPGHYFRKYFAKEPLVPLGGFKWKEQPRLPLDRLSKR
jgi:uncharacterized Fe-S center protein